MICHLNKKILKKSEYQFTNSKLVLSETESLSFESLWRSFASEMQSTETLFVGENFTNIKH